MKVLVVDDDIVSRMVLMHLIDNCGQYEIVEADDGEDAWVKLEQGLAPGIVFCDLRMPRLSGMELLARVKAVPRLGGTPFVLVTSANDGDTLRQASALGADGYIVKPFDPAQVRAQLAHLAAPAPPAEAGPPVVAPSATDENDNAHDDAKVNPIAGASGDAADPDEVEMPSSTAARLGIDAARLLVYLGGYQAQLDAARGQLPAMLETGDEPGVRARLGRLNTGGATLGLHAAARRLADLGAGALDGGAIAPVLESVLRTVARQIGSARRLVY